MKKFIFSIMIVMLSAMLAICASAANTYKKGDANMDGSINAADARLVLRASAMLDKFNENQKRICDMNNDGAIKASDARMVLRVAARLDKNNETVTIGGSSNGNSNGSSSKTELSGGIGTSFSSFMKTYGSLKKLDTNNKTVAYGNNYITVSSDSKIINDEKISSIKITGGKYSLCGISVGMSYSDALSTLKNAKWVASKETKTQAVLTKNGMKLVLSISDKTVKSVEYSFASSINQVETTTKKPETKPETTTKPEVTTTPITNEAYKKLPDQAKAFINGEFGLKGYMYNQGQKEKMSLYCSKNAVKIGMPMEMTANSVTELEFLITDINTVPQIYLINKENEVCMKMSTDMFESLSGGTTDEMLEAVKHSGFVDINNLKITQRTEKENNITYTVYKISGAKEYVELYMIGDNIKRIYTYNDAGNLAMRIDADVFYEKVSSSEFSIKQYTVIDFESL